MKKFSFLFSVFLLFACLCGCSLKKDDRPLVIDEKDSGLVCIHAERTDGLQITGDTTLASYMEDLKKAGKIDFEIKNGMVISIDGLKASGGRYWMLYTDDKDNSDNAWGTVMFRGKVYDSAAYGMELLHVKEGCTYIWHLQEMQ